MRKILLALATVLAITSCGDDDSTEDAQDYSSEKLQNEAFANVQKQIVGEWRAAKFYNDGSYSDYWNKPLGWLDIGSKKVSYTFNSDGTYKGDGHTGSYKIYKNPYYIQSPNYTVPTYLETTPANSGVTTKRGITISEDGYMRLYSIYKLYGSEYADFSNYQSNYMYSK